MAVCPNCGEENPDKARFCMVCATPLETRPAPPQEARKTVTVVFCDLVGSTALGERLDSESLREVMDRYFNEMRSVLERHGGIVEKYIGDAIMAVFGLPRAHEDDAFRAVRAAVEMSAKLEGLNVGLESQWALRLSNRTGINTGEVVVGDPAFGQRLATGDTINVAARLEQAASSNEILMGQATYRLVKDAVSVEAVEPLALKGKSLTVPAFLLKDVKQRVEGISRHLDAPLVGRGDELDLLFRTFQKVREDRTCHLITVVGEPGVGKSRLLIELADRIGKQATIVRGRCLSYGEGITFWPLAEVIRDLAGIAESDSRQLARDKLGMQASDEVIERIASVVGLSEASFAIEELFWAARVFLEGFAREHPLAVVVEDIHWAEEAFLDLIDHIVDLAAAPILIICAARPELLEGRRRWGQVSAETSIVELRPLSVEQSGILINNLLMGSSDLAQEIVARITAATQGNPLFVEQIISMWMDEGALYRVDGYWSLSREASKSVPPSISALLMARLDRLTNAEGAVIAAASIMGQVFYPTALGLLCPELSHAEISSALDKLQSKQFVRPDPSFFARRQAFAFRHILIRDTAYTTILKRTRAHLHETLATWLEGQVADRITEFQEIVGHHLEQAYRYRVELSASISEVERRLADRAAKHLASAAARSFGRADIGATVNLIDRAASLLPPSSEERALLLIDLAIALSESGELLRADEVLAEVAAITRNLGNARVEARASLAKLLLDLSVRSPDISVDETRRRAEATLPVFERAADDIGLARAWLLIGECYWDLGMARLTEEAMARAEECARNARSSWEESQALFWLSVARPLGPTPVKEALALSRENLDRTRGLRHAHAMTLTVLATLEAMDGRFDDSHRNLAAAVTILDEMGMKSGRAVQSLHIADVEMLAGNFEVAERELRRGIAFLEQVGEKGFLSTGAAQLAEVLCEEGRYDEAETLTYKSQQTAAEDDVWSQLRWRGARARILAHQGRDQDAVRVIDEAVGLSTSTDWLNMHATLLKNRGEVLWAIGRRLEARRSLEEALRRFEQKGNVVSAAKVRDLLDDWGTQGDVG